MNLPLSPEPADEAVADLSSEEAVRELLLKAMSGDKPAAYELLGRQAPVETWVKVVRQLARDASVVDLELVAHRTLRRPPAVVGAVLELARAAQSPIAAFLARVVVDSRTEENLRSDGASLSSELNSLFDVAELLAADQPTAALYALLARPLADQARFVSEASDGDATTSLFDAARGEYERLQDVARDTRWRSGSYRHALRHALADLALVGAVGGRLEDQAFRLLQQRTDQPDANAELLELVSADVRSRYLEWSLDRSSAESSPARAIFALSELTRHPEAANRNTVQRLLGSKDSDVAAAAAAYLVASDPDDGSNDREIAELLTAADDARRARVIGAIAADAPARLRLDLWPPATDATVVEKASTNPRPVERLTATIRESSDPDVRLRALQVAAAIGDSLTDREAMALALVGAVIAHTDASDREIELLLAYAWLREAAWRVLDEAAPLVRMDCLHRLLQADPAVVVWEQLSDLHARTPLPHRRELEATVVDAVATGRLDAEVLATEAPAFLDVLRAGVERRASAAGDEVERLRSLIALGERAAEVELGELVQPLIARAIERSTGNERLIDDYREVGATISPTTHEGGPTSESPVSDEAELAEIAAALAATGVDLRAAGGRVSAVIGEGVTLAQIVRALAILDQRVARASDGLQREMAVAALAATADAVASSGEAEQIVRDLFERGPLFQAAVALSPHARLALLEATIRFGFEPPDAWREHDVLGGWLIEATGAASPIVSEPATAADALMLLQRIEQERRDAEERLRAGRTAARHAFVASATTALEHLEQTTDTYVQLWLGLGRLGIRQIAALGERIDASELDPSRFEIVGSGESQSYVVRSGGLEVEGEIVRRARVEEVN